MKAAYEDIISSKSFAHWRWERSWLVCQREEGDPNDEYVIDVKTDVMTTVQIKCNNDLSSFQLAFRPEPKLAHGSVKFLARSISHFVMNIIMAKTGSTAEVNSTK